MSTVSTGVRRFIRADRVRNAALASGVAEEFASSYVAGADATEARVVVERLRRQGLLVSLAYLPTSNDEAETPGALVHALEVLDALAVGAELSIKPSSLGLRTDPASAASRLRDLCDAAEQRGAVVTLEMQGAEAYDETLRLWRGVHAHHGSLGLTLPSDIRRSEREVASVSAEGARVRLCVGSYPVPRSIGLRSEREKSKALVRCLRRAMEDGGYAMLASHDPTLIAIAQELAHRNAVPANGFEFQMFYGVRPLEQRRLSDIGYRSRTYLPFGPAWFEYLTTRLAARPRTMFSYLRALGDKR